jgi:hypothetical protein
LPDGNRGQRQRLLLQRRLVHFRHRGRSRFYWNGSSNTAIIGKDNSASGAVYKGLALLGTSLVAANFNSGKIDVYDATYNLTSLEGSFTDSNLPAGLAPHGIPVIGSQPNDLPQFLFGFVLPKLGVQADHDLLGARSFFSTLHSAAKK